MCTIVDSNYTEWNEQSERGMHKAFNDINLYLILDNWNFIDFTTLTVAFLPSKLAYLRILRLLFVKQMTPWEEF